MAHKAHPEAALYQHHREEAGRYRQRVHARRTGAEWEQAASLLAALISLLQAYNRVLWTYFPYCRQCLGGCCVVGATDLKPLDFVALAVLDETLPNVPRTTGREGRACIYLTPQGCSWPARWRPLKCALFYCLGSGAIAVDASDARYGEITAALEEAVGPALARLLPAAAETLLPLLPDPVAFADALAEALAPHLVDPLCEELPAPRPVRAANTNPGDLMTFIAATMEAILADRLAPPPGDDLTPDQLLADLETLAWIVEGRPGHAARLLAEMGRRYPLDGDRPPSVWQQMGVQIREVAADFGE